MMKHHNVTAITCAGVQGASTWTKYKQTVVWPNSLNCRFLLQLTLPFHMSHSAWCKRWSFHDHYTYFFIYFCHKRRPLILISLLYLETLRQWTIFYQRCWTIQYMSWCIVWWFITESYLAARLRIYHFKMWFS